MMKMSMDHTTFPSDVGAALRCMRKAEVEKQPLELQKDENEKRIKFEVEATLDRVLKKDKRKKKKKKNNEDDGHLVMNINNPGMQMKSINELKKVAFTFYQFANSQRNLHLGEERLGQPRPIFKGLVAEIKRMTLDNSIDEPVVNPYMTASQPCKKKLRPLTARSPIPAPHISVPNLANVPSRPKSASNASKSKKKLALEKEREMQLATKIFERENREKNRLSAFQRNQRQKSFLIIISFLRHQCAVQHVWSEMKAKRLLRTQRMLASSAIRAVGIICSWWARQYLIRRLRNSSKVCHIITSFIIRVKHKRRLSQRNAAVGFIKRFIRDACRLSDKKVQINRYRNKIIKLQRWIRNFLRIQEYRIWILWIACERSGRMRLMKHKRTHANNQLKAMKTMSALEGFSKVFQGVHQVKNKIAHLHSQYDQRKRQWLSEEEQELDAVTPTVGHGQAVARGGQTKKEGKARAWIRWMLSSQATAAKLQVLRSILKSQRRRHVLEIQETQILLKKNDRKVNESALRDFLRNPKVHDGIDRVFEVVDKKSGKRLIESATIRRHPPFLLLSKGALSHIDSLEDSFFYKSPL